MTLKFIKPEHAEQSNDHGLNGRARMSKWHTLAVGSAVVLTTSTGCDGHNPASQSAPPLASPSPSPSSSPNYAPEQTMFASLSGDKDAKSGRGNQSVSVALSSESGLEFGCDGEGQAHVKFSPAARSGGNFTIPCLPEEKGGMIQNVGLLKYPGKLTISVVANNDVAWRLVVRPLPIEFDGPPA